MYGRNFKITQLLFDLFYSNYILVKAYINHLIFQFLVLNISNILKHI